MYLFLYFLALATTCYGATSSCQGRRPSPAGYTCFVIGKITRPSVLQNSKAGAATTYQECEDYCYSVNGCQSFGWVPSKKQCTFYKRVMHAMGFQKERRAPNPLVADRGCLICNCNPTLKNGAWEVVPVQIAPWIAGGDTGYKTRIVIPGYGGSKHALKSTPPVSDSTSYYTVSTITQTFTWCSYQTYLISFKYLLANPIDSLLNVYIGETSGTTTLYSAQNDNSLTWEDGFGSYTPTLDQGYIMFEFGTYTFNQTFLLDNIAITLQQT